jgi:hypothetical protein
MFNFPIDADIVNSVGSRIRDEDSAKAPHDIKPTSINSHAVGVTILLEGEGESQKDTLFFIHLTKDHPFQKGTEGQELPSAITIKPTGDSDPFIAVSTTWMIWYRTGGWKQRLAEAIMNHEIGHFKAGHIHGGQDMHRLKGIDKESSYCEIADVLLTGAVYEHEFEADIWAMRISEDPIDAVMTHTFYAEYSDTLGIRLEHSNRAAKLLRLLNSDEWQTLTKDDEYTTEVILYKDENLEDTAAMETLF